MEKHFMKKEDLVKMPKDYVEPIADSYEEFPASQARPAGMKNLKINLEKQYPEVFLNIVYAHKSDKNLHLDIIVPATKYKDQRFPLIMWVQGSAFHKQQLGNHMAHMINVAKHGFVVAMVEYRYAPVDAFPVQVKDLNTATRFMLDHANEYHVNVDKYLAWGESSGGHTVSLATVTENNQFFSDEDINVRTLSFRCCIDFYGPTDISQMNKVSSTQDHVTAHSFEGEFLGTKNIYEHPELVQKANPINYVDEHKIPPFLIMHGNKDRLVPFEQSCIFYEALKKHNKQIDFYRIENSDHATDGFFSPEALKVVFNFIEKSIGD